MNAMPDIVAAKRGRPRECAAGVLPARLAGHYRLDAVRAHLLEKTGDHQAAVERYLAAAGRTASIPERNYLQARAARLSAARLNAPKAGG